MHVIYRLAASAHDIEARAQSIAIEQSIEMPPRGVRSERVLAEVLGRVEDIRADGPAHYRVTIGLALETTGFEAGQLMNMLFGNSSLNGDIELLDVTLPPAAAARFAGPRFGIAGLRKALAIGARPMTCSALKPLGSTTEELAALAGQLALAGIDMVKDDHGLANQDCAPFAARVAAVQKAVDTANRSTGGRTLYAPNLGGGPAQFARQLAAARDAGVGALMIAPMISGMGALQELAGTGLPILAHPALAGSARIAPQLLLGKLFRLAGADAVIYPNYGGRFSFSQTLCGQLADTMRAPWHTLSPCCPVPAGGIQLSRIEELAGFYGADTMLLIGGALLESADPYKAARDFVTKAASLEPSP